MAIERNVVSFEEFEASVNRECLEPDKIRAIYDRVVSLLEAYTPQRCPPEQKISVTLTAFYDGGGRQLIANGAVSDLSRPVRNEYNWHLQNTSQWLFACGVVWDKAYNDFSIHT